MAHAVSKAASILKRVRLEKRARREKIAIIFFNTIDTAEYESTPVCSQKRINNVPVFHQRFRPAGKTVQIAFICNAYFYALKPTTYFHHPDIFEQQVDTLIRVGFFSTSQQQQPMAGAIAEHTKASRGLKNNLVGSHPSTFEPDVSALRTYTFGSV